ncbi:type ISP restriction/modification enzyme [Leptolinea tardivitalis]|uniref:site-specific DNA-methyltransferase (adenine-specific) n=1 Tax=Leptolinea tardivitalis TaxID=229920 RepID=A0A0P6XNR0_9CHLR|nr:type ISP restriction/modification enzyme [Leptolinea tardivitalis]KPL73711.1 DNA methyltransferase [Leptolinea tardivitalis]GAP22817.1 predicted helicase [Leptolinea tardivitalis]
MTQTLQNYLASISEITQRDDSREESYYSTLETLLLTLATKTVKVTTLPKKTEAGNPDFRVWDGRQHITGYIEAKKPGTNLDQVETTDQLKRYLKTFPNLILTDFYEFRLYREGNLIKQVQIGRQFIAKKLRTLPPLENEEQFAELIEYFFNFSLPRTFTANTLARELAKRTRFLRDEIVSQEIQEQQEQPNQLHGFFEAFKKYLIPALDEKTFADLYAQTVAYGLFAARSRSGESFSRQTAVNFIPRSIGILHDVFQYISLGNPSPQMEVIIDDIADVLSVADIDAILHQYARQGKGSDPIMHFYETFLSVYDPALREARGVYYTPEPVVGFIVRSIHDLLKTRFGLSDGLASPEVTMLDPAAGTLTFPAEAIRLAVDEFTRKYGEGGKARFIQEHILKNFYAFELMMAPYAMGHMKINLLLEELGYTLQNGERFNLYLTNTLDMKEIEATALPGLSALSHESKLAAKVKKQDPILVIMGNPPYSGMSANRSEWTEKLLKTDLDGAQSYYSVDGKPLGEKNPKWLQDDYVKFLRFAQWKIEKAGRGIVGMITNHSYLDNPTFRGMRQSLMKTFDEIYIVNLHGNSLKKEIAPDGSKDENVFDIQQGVAIVLLIKGLETSNCVIKQIDLFGLRENKYRWLENLDIGEVQFSFLSPESPHYFLIPRKTKDIKQYENWFPIDKAFLVNRMGIVTSRDDFIIDFSKDQLKRRIFQLQDTQISNELLANAYKLIDKPNWSLQNTRSIIQSESDLENYFRTILYRPFDNRTIFYHDALLERSRLEIMRHMIQGENIGLCLSKRVEGNKTWDHIFISKTIITHHTVSLKEGNFLFPLYQYPDPNQRDLFSSSTVERQPNISSELINILSSAYERQPIPEEILYYIYGIFYCPSYRSTYAEYLRTDFPRVPFAGDYAVFRQMADYGKRLADLHLLESPELDPPVCRYQGSGGNDRVEKVVYDPADGRVHINAGKYFEGISPEMWTYQIGGYQVLNKYLKDRKGRLMDDPRRYARIATAIQKTIEIQSELDPVFHQIENNYLPINLP